MENQTQKTIEEQVNELTEQQKNTIIKVGKRALALQLIGAIPMLVLCIIGLYSMVNPPMGYDYMDSEKIFSGIMTLLVIMAVYVIGITVFVKVKWPYYSDKKWQYINKMRKRK